MNRTRPVLALLAALVLPACEPGAGNNGPSTQEIQQTRRGDAGSDAAAETMKAASDAVLDSGSNNAVSTQATARRTGSSLRAEVAGFFYAAAVDVTIDLDALDGAGHDVCPNASGQLHIAAAGTVSGTSTAGNAVYAIQTNWVTDGVFTDPASGCVATMSAGSGFTWALTVSWNWIAADNWTLSGTNDYVGQHTVTVEHGGQSWTVACQGERHAGAVFTQTPAGFAAGFAVRGHLEIVVTGPDGVHSVVFDWAGAGLVTVTCDGEVHGPYLVGVASAVFGCSLQ